jgi:hypothetical protein
MAAVLEVGPSERLFRLFTIEETLNQTSGNWYQFMKTNRSRFPDSKAVAKCGNKRKASSPTGSGGP